MGADRVGFLQLYMCGIDSRQPSKTAAESWADIIKKQNRTKKRNIQQKKICTTAIYREYTQQRLLLPQPTKICPAQESIYYTHRKRIVHTTADFFKKIFLYILHNIYYITFSNKRYFNGRSSWGENQEKVEEGECDV